MIFGAMPEKYRFCCQSPALPPSKGGPDPFQEIEVEYSQNRVDIEDVYGSVKDFTDKMTQHQSILSSATHYDKYYVGFKLTDSAWDFIQNADSRFGHLIEKWIRDAYLHIDAGINIDVSMELMMEEGVKNLPRYQLLTNEDKYSLFRRAYLLANRFYQVTGRYNYPAAFDFGGDADLCNTGGIGEIKISGQGKTWILAYYQAMLYAVRCALHSDFPIEEMVLSTIHFATGRIHSYVVNPWKFMEYCMETHDPINNQMRWIGIGSGLQFDMIQRCRHQLAARGKGHFS